MDLKINTVCSRVGTSGYKVTFPTVYQVEIRLINKTLVSPWYHIQSRDKLVEIVKSLEDETGMTATYNVVDWTLGVGNSEPINASNSETFKLT